MSPLRQIRAARGWTQAQLAHEAGVDQATVSRVERGSSCSALALRNIAHALSVTTEDLLRGFPAAEFGQPNIALSGYTRTGKDTLASELVEKCGYTRIAFADPLKAIALSLNPTLPSGLTIADSVNTVGWDRLKASNDGPSVRDYLQKLGDVLKDELCDHVLIQTALEKIEKSTTPVVVTDVRTAKEVEALGLRGFSFLLLTRPGTGPANEHSTENELWELAGEDGSLISQDGAWKGHSVYNAGTPADLLRDALEALS